MIPPVSMMICLLMSFMITIAGAETKNAITARKIIAAVPADFPPTYYRDSETGTPKGFAIDVMNEVARRSGLQVEYVFGQLWDEILRMLQNGQADVVPNLTIDDNRKKRFAFTKTVETLPISYIVRSDQNVSGSASGMKVGVMQDSVAHNFLAPGKDITLVQYKSLQHLLFDLLAGQLDMALTATPNVMKLAEDAGIENKIRVLEPPVMEGLRGMALRTSDTELLNTLNKAIDEFVGSNDYRKIYQKWWGKPAPFLNIYRIVIVTLMIIAVTMVAMGTWRYLTTVKLNRKIREASEKAERERLKSDVIVESVSDGISIQDTDMRILYQNARHIELSGGVFTGEFCYRAYEKRDTTCEECPVLKTMTDGEPARAVRSITTPAGMMHIEIFSSPIRDEHGKITSVIECVRDISERMRIEEERLENILFIESLLKHSPVGVRVFDGESGRCILANRAAAQIAGGDTDTLLRQNFRELDSWHDCGLLEIADAVLADGGDRKVETDMHTSFGKQVSVSYIVSRFDVKEKHHLLVIGRDITDEKRLAEEHRKIEIQMLHVQKLESLGVLAGGIAHDFNNILMAVLGNAELALRHLSPESPARDNLLKIEQAAQRAADLARQMLAYSGKGHFVIEPHDINSLITEMNHILEVSISKKAVMRFNLAKDLPLFEVDATQIRQIIMNLVINASEAIGERSGIISISTGAKECDKAYLSEMWLGDDLPEGLYIYFEIADTGCGMDKGTLSKIFDPFFTTKFTGRGLGMAAVLGIVRGHKGAVKVYSEPGKGTCFKVLLPATRNSTAASLRESLATKPPMGSGTVLLVDDEETIRALGKDMLKELGFKVLTAENGLDSLELFKASTEKIACIILDLTMPHMDGEQTFQELRRINPDVPIIMSSGYNEHEVTQKFIGKGLAGFIQKPYKLTELGQKLREAIGE